MPPGVLPGLLPEGLLGEVSGLVVGPVPVPGVGGVVGGVSVCGAGGVVTLGGAAGVPGAVCEPMLLGSLRRRSGSLGSVGGAGVAAPGLGLTGAGSSRPQALSRLAAASVHRAASVAADGVWAGCIRNLLGAKADEHGFGRQSGFLRTYLPTS
jgi:hypothetical protein